VQEFVKRCDGLHVHVRSGFCTVSPGFTMIFVRAEESWGYREEIYVYQSVVDLVWNCMRFVLDPLKGTKK
jgi:hypothetical protein